MLIGGKNQFTTLDETMFEGVACIGNNLSLVLRIFDGARDLVSFFVQAGLVQGLAVQYHVLLHVRVEDGQLLVAVRGVDEVLHVEVAVAQERESRP